MAGTAMIDDIKNILSEYGPCDSKQVAAHLRKRGFPKCTNTLANRCLYANRNQFDLNSDVQPPQWSAKGGGGGARATAHDRPSRGQSTTGRPAAGRSVTPPVSTAPTRPEIDPTIDQKRLIEFEPNGNLLIRGEAGAGKTTVLARRAGYIKSALLHSGSMLFLTYNSALAAYVKRLAAESESTEQLVVTTFHNWANQFVKQISTRPPSYVKRDRARTLITEIVHDLRSKWPSNQLMDKPIQFWEQEIQWILGQGIYERDEYLNCQRMGCGTAIQVRGKDREFVWDVCDRYNRALEASNEADWEDPGGVVLQAVRKNGGQFPKEAQYDHVFIDEVQDFNLSWLLALTPIPRQSLTMAGDLAQRIYRRNFSWSKAGIKLPPARSKKLVGSHRTTKQIMEVASLVATNHDLAGDEDYQAPTIPDRIGPKVVRIRRDCWQDAQSAAIAHAGQLHRARPDETVIVAAQFNKTAKYFADRLTQTHAPAEALSGQRLAEDVRLATTTFHQLKGLEFDHLILVGMEDNTMPCFYFKQQDAETEQEKEHYLRRLVYVAMTRARVSVSLAGGTPFSRFFDGIPDRFFEDR